MMPLPTSSPRATFALAAILLALPLTAHAQATAPADTIRPQRWELRITSGSLIPVGEQRQQLTRGPLSTVQLSWLPRPSLAVTGTVGWATSRDLTAVAQRGVNAFAVDLGIETRPSRLIVGERVTFSPLAGIGAGARSYDYRSRHADATHNVAAFAAIGGELGYRRLGVRVEARQYLAGFAPMDGVGTTPARSDVMLLTSLRFNRRALARR
jgi:hypothetical protein